MKNQRRGKAAIFQKRDIEKIRRNFNVAHQRCIFEIALYTGERMGAIVQLKVSDVYRDPIRQIPHDEITFAASTRKASPDGSKTTRQVILHPDLKAYLKSYLPPESGYLFPGVNISKRNSCKHLTRRSVDKYWREQFLKLSMDKRGFSTHSTRRWLITQLVNNGVDIKTVQSITGHKNINVLLGYVEGNEKVIKNAIATIDV